MNGTLHKTEEGWIVRWSDLHSFGHGWHWEVTLIHPDEQQSITDDSEGKEVDVEFKVGSDFCITWATFEKTPKKPHELQE